MYLIRFFFHPRCICTNFKFLGRNACGNVLWLQLFFNGPYISKKGSRNQHGTTCLGRLISLPKFGEVSTLDEQARCYCLKEEQPVNIHVHLVRHKSRWAPVLGRKMAVKGLENQLLGWNLDYQILVKWLPVFPFTNFWGWWPCKPWMVVHFKVSNTRERKWYPTRTVKKNTIWCALVDRSCRCTEISYSSLQSPKLIRGFAPIKTARGGHQFGDGSFRVSQIRFTKHWRLSFNSNNWIDSQGQRIHRCPGGVDGKGQH